MNEIQGINYYNISSISTSSFSDPVSSPNSQVSPGSRFSFGENTPRSIHIDLDETMEMAQIDLTVSRSVPTIQQPNESVLRDIQESSSSSQNISIPESGRHNEGQVPEISITEAADDCE